MPTFDASTILMLISIGVFTIAAGISDYRLYRIPNKLTLPMFGLGLVYQLAFHGLEGLGDAGKAFAAGFGILFVLWLIGGGGGGDVKLMGALSVWLGFKLTLAVMGVSTILVLFGTFFVLFMNVVTKGAWATREKFISATITKRRKDGKPVIETSEQKAKRRIMAYAIPISIATWGVLIYVYTKPFWMTQS